MPLSVPPGSPGAPGAPGDSSGVTGFGSAMHYDPDEDPFLLVRPVQTASAPTPRDVDETAADTATRPLPPTGGPGGAPGGGAAGRSAWSRSGLVPLAVVGILAVLAGIMIAVARNNSSAPDPVNGITAPASTATYSPLPIPFSSTDPTDSPTPTASATESNDGGQPAKVIADEVNLRNGPASRYPGVDLVNKGDGLTVLCVAYGEPISSNALWEYTSRGWVADSYLNTGSDHPTEPGCTGSIDSPTVGGSTATPTTGPFAVLSDDSNGAPAHAGPYTSSDLSSTLPEGTLTSIECSESGDEVDGPGGATSDWDRLGDGSYVPDALLDTYTAGSPAQSC